MPGTDGLQLIDAARAMRPDLPAVLISGHADAMTQSRQGRTTRFVRKPFRMEELVEQLTAALEDAHAVRSPA